MFGNKIQQPVQFYFRFFSIFLLSFSSAIFHLMVTNECHIATLFQSDWKAQGRNLSCVANSLDSRQALFSFRFFAIFTTILHPFHATVDDAIHEICERCITSFVQCAGEMSKWTEMSQCMCVFVCPFVVRCLIQNLLWLGRIELKFASESMRCNTNSCECCNHG